MSDAVLPPSLRPESPVSITLVDDQTQVFQPQFGRGRAQRQLYGDPRWRMRMRFRGMRDHERARLRMAIAESRGKGLALRVTPYQVLRGSFPATELLTQSTEFTSTSGLSTSNCTITAVDRAIRMAVSQNDATAAPIFYQTSAVGSAGSAYAARGAVMALSNPLLYTGLYVNYFDAAPTGDGYVVGRRGLITVAGVLSASDSPRAVMYNIPGHKVGDNSVWTYMSMARCALVDAGQNYLTNSTDITAAGWGTTAITRTANAVTSPVGDTTADSINDTAVTSEHTLEQAYTSSSALEPWNLSVALRYSSRQWARVQIYSTSGSVYTYVDLQNGVFGTQGTTGTWTNRVRGLAALGNGWYRVSIAGLKPAGDTVVNARVALASADATASYLGNGSGFYVWGPTLSKSNLPTSLVVTTSSAIAGSVTGSTISVTGLPASTAGLLLPGDFVEIDGELKMVMAPLDSEADGIGTLQVRPAIATALSHMRPVIVNNPMGRFMLAGDPDISVLFGNYDDVELDLIEVYE